MEFLKIGRGRAALGRLAGAAQSSGTSLSRAISLAREDRMRPIFYFIVMLMAAISASPTSAQSLQKWVTGSVQGPYPIGNPAAQPDVRFAFPSLETGARDQSFRLIVRPDLWGHQARFRFSNALGTKPVTFDGVHIGLQWTAAALVPGSNRPVSFAGKSATTVATGSSVWSDP